MGYYKYIPVVIVPAAKVVEFNSILERQGYGPSTLSAAASNAVIEKASAKTAPATHYVLETHADAGFLAAITLAFGVVNGKVATKDKGSIDTVMNGRLKSSRVNAVLEKAGKKTKVDRIDLA